jgi:putative OmpL-like beta-barrel porin-2
MTRRLGVLTIGMLFAATCLVATGVPAFGQTTQTPPPAETKPGEAKPDDKKEEEKPKTLWEEHTLFAYIENSIVWNTGNASRGNHNELRFYDFEGGYTFNMAEFSIKKDPSDRYPFGYGLVLTAGIPGTSNDSQKNHALGIFRGDDDQFSFRNTPNFDLQEAYASYKIPIGEGLTLKAGKWVTLIGYEVIESPNNLNFSRSYLFAFSIPLTHVGALLSYPVTSWFTITAGTVVGWDVARDNNGTMSYTGQFAFTPVKDLIFNFNWITGAEQAHTNSNPRTVLDYVLTYTGISKLTLGLNVDYGWETDEAYLKASGTRGDIDASWWGWAAYAAYDWTEAFRTALRVEYMKDAQGVRTQLSPAGKKLDLWEVTATAQYKIWKGLVGRVEYRHDSANEKVFAIRAPGYVPTGKTQDTISFDFYYLFF